MKHLYIFLTLFIFCISCTAKSQTKHLSGTLIGESFKDTELYIKAMESTRDNETVKFDIKELRFEGELPLSSDGFYSLYGVNNNTQILIPLYLPNEGKEYQLSLQYKDGSPMVELDADNNALSAFLAITYTKGRELWMNLDKINSENALPILKEYSAAADSIAQHYNCSEPVKQYLKIWAYTTANNYFENLAHSIKNSELEGIKESLLEDPLEILNTNMSVYFPTATHMIIRSMPKISLSGQIEYLYKTYTADALCKYIQEMLIDGYIRNFNYSVDYEKGLKELSSVVKQYQLSNSHIENFMMRKASIKGTPFPENIVLADINGDKVDFKQFKGSYVYIDLWASWCGPCCKEIPHLQLIEKELNNEKVRFVSISIDTNINSWKNKMKELNMHGTQLINQDNKLAEALNVKGVPFFLIYDKDGELYMYGAPRPSQTENLKEVLNNLK